jgi:hypothetical protein
MSAPEPSERLDSVIISMIEGMADEGFTLDAVITAAGGGDAPGRDQLLRSLVRVRVRDISNRMSIPGYHAAQMAASRIAVDWFDRALFELEAVGEIASMTGIAGDPETMTIGELRDHIGWGGPDAGCGLR